MSRASNTRVLVGILVLAAAHAFVRAQAPQAPVDVARGGTTRPLWQRWIEAPRGARLVALRDTVIVAAGSAGLMAYAASDGRPLWATAAVPATDIAAVPPLAVVIATSGVFAIAPDSGRPIWRSGWQPGHDDPAIGTAGDLIVATTRTELAAFSQSGTLFWKTSLGAEPVTRVVGGEGFLAIGTATEQLVGIDPASGAILWRVSLGTRLTALTAAGADLYATTSSGTLEAFRAGRTVRRRWRFEVLGAVGHPVVHEDLVVAAFLDNSVRAFARSGGSQRWSRLLPGRLAGNLFVVGGRIVGATTNGRIAAWEARSGHPALGAPPTEPPRLYVHAVDVDATTATLFTLRTADDGRQVLTAWRVGG